MKQFIACSCCVLATLAGCGLYQDGGCGSGPIQAPSQYQLAATSTTWGTARIKVVDSNGAPVVGAQMQVTRATGFFLFCVGPSAEQRTDMDGIATFDQILPGHYEVGILPDLPPYLWVPFKINAGETTDATFVAKPGEGGVN